jgi:hypothetical protein
VQHHRGAPINRSDIVEERMHYDSVAFTKAKLPETFC